MPRDLAINSKKYSPDFVISSQSVLRRLAIQKAPNCAVFVMQTLMAYSFGKDSCFPSHKTIQDWLGGKEAIALSTIRKGVKWLEDHGLIKRNHHRSKKRYLLFVTRSSKLKTSSAQKPQEELQTISIEDQVNDPVIEVDRSSLDKTATVSPKQSSYRYERSTSTATNVAHKSKSEENSKPPISPVQAQGTVKGNDDSSEKQKRTWRTPEQRRKTKQERRLLKAKRQHQEQKQQEEHSEWHRRQRLEKLTMAIAFSKRLPALEFQSDLEHLEPYVQNYLESISAEALIVLKITDKQVFLRLVKHLIWDEVKMI